MGSAWAGHRLLTVSLLAILFPLSFLIFLPSSASSPVATVSYGPTWEQVCQGNACTVTLYQHQKFYRDGGEWRQIDERFQACPEGFCVTGNLYQATVAQGAVELHQGASALSFRLEGIDGWGNLSLSAPTRMDNQLTHANALPGADLRYTYLPRRFKEELTLRDRVLSGFSQDPVLNYSLSRTGAGLSLLQPIACDAEDECVLLPAAEQGGRYLVTLPLDWFNNATRPYPVTIDPSVALNGSVNDDGDLERNVGCSGSSIARDANATTIAIGHRRTIISGSPPLISDECRRGFLFFTTAALPANARIGEILAVLHTSALGNDSNNLHQARPFELNSTQYPDTSAGNLGLWEDAGNGTAFLAAWSAAKAGKNVVNFTSASFSDLQDRLRSGAKWWGFSIVSPENNSGNFWSILHRYRSSEAADASKRPSLNISYLAFADEAAGRTAIEQGINASLPNNPILTDQQAYLLNEQGQQFLGRFDHATQSVNQTWGFNYATEGEAFTSMPSLFRILNIWENSSLYADEIALQVEGFIGQTKE